jgi:hypothetical protein
MARPSRIPDRGDVPRTTVARLLGLSPADFDRLLPDLERRSFPSADTTTGLFCIEAVDKWRLARHPKLFPALTDAPAALHAESVFAERLNRMGGGHG